MLFVGRAHALARLLAAVDDAAGGQARVVLVAGEAGMGKTTLVGVAAARSGLSLGWGTCVEAGRTPAFWPWSAALRGLLTDVGPSRAAELTRDDTAELARLLPELVNRPDAAVDPAGPADTDAARLRLFDAVARLLERLARQRPALVVLDDLQWADESSLQLLEFVTQPVRPVPLVVVGMYRDDELTEEAARSLARTATRGESLQLHGLSAGEVFDLVAGAVGADVADRWAGEVHRRTDGHPFLARQLAELLADPVQPAGVVPAAVHDLIARRLNRLSPACRELVKAAAVAGTELRPDVLGEVCGVDVAAVTALVEEAVPARPGRTPNAPTNSAYPACATGFRPHPRLRHLSRRAGRVAVLRRHGELWFIQYGTASAHLRGSKGLADLHTLLSRPGTDVHVLDLAGAGHAERDSGTLLDPTARAAYRRRLDELDHELAGARADHDSGRAQRLDDQRAALIAELPRAAGLAGRTRRLGASTSERARKTVTSRLREAIRRIEAVLPELGAHLDRSVITGTVCRYEPTTNLAWRLSPGTAADRLSRSP